MDQSSKWFQNNTKKTLSAFRIYQFLFCDWSKAAAVNWWRRTFRLYIVRSCIVTWKDGPWLLPNPHRVIFQIVWDQGIKSLFYKSNTCLQETTTCIGLQAEQIFSVNIQYTYFSILAVTFTVPFLCYFQKLQLLVAEECRSNFCCFVLLHLWAEKVCLRFLKSYFKLEILMFLSSVVSRRSTKRLFFDEKNISGEIWDIIQ